MSELKYARKPLTLSEWAAIGWIIGVLSLMIYGYTIGGF